MNHHTFFRFGTFFLVACLCLTAWRFGYGPLWGFLNFIFALRSPIIVWIWRVRVGIGIIGLCLWFWWRRWSWFTGFFLLGERQQVLKTNITYLERTYYKLRTQKITWSKCNLFLTRIWSRWNLVRILDKKIIQLGHLMLVCRIILTESKSDPLSSLASLSESMRPWFLRLTILGNFVCQILENELVFWHLKCTENLNQSQPARTDRTYRHFHCLLTSRNLWLRMRTIFTWALSALKKRKTEGGEF